MHKSKKSLNIPNWQSVAVTPYKTPYKERYIAGSSTCSTKELSIHLTKILSAVKEGQQKYCETVYSPKKIKNDPLDKKKYRPVSILTTISKIYEMVLSDQLVEFLIIFFMIFYVLSESAMDVRPHYWDSLKIGNQLSTRIAMWQLFRWIFRKLLIVCHMTFFSVNWLLMDCHPNQ